MFPWHTKATFALLALAAFAFGCAAPGPSAPPPPDTSKLLAAGFKIIPATTQTQMEQLQALPPGRLTEWQKTGKKFFVYPDVAGRQLYAGRPQDYEAYVRLVPGGGVPSLAQQSKADMASYNKQDSGMELLTKRDKDDPYWSLDDVGFR